jgi:hypothetical protein
LTSVSVDTENLNDIYLFAQDILLKATLSGYLKRDSMSLYNRQVLIKEILKSSSGISSTLLSFIIHDMMEFIHNPIDFYLLLQDMRSLLFLFLENKPKESWGIISKLLLKDKDALESLLTILNPQNDTYDRRGIDSVLSDTEIMDWCRQNDKAPEILPSLIPVVIIEGENPKFHSLIYKLFDEQLYNERTLAQIYNNMIPETESCYAISLCEHSKIALKTLKGYKDSLIINWVAKSLDELDKRIEFEKKMDEEFFHRF